MGIVQIEVFCLNGPQGPLEVDTSSSHRKSGPKICNYHVKVLLMYVNEIRKVFSSNYYILGIARKSLQTLTVLKELSAILIPLRSTYNAPPYALTT